MKLNSLFLFLLFSLIGFSQTGRVSGTILDKEYDNEPLVFANVLIKGTTIGTSTDDFGKYSISLKPGSYTLVINYLGYETKEFPITIKANQTVTINYTLEASGVQLQDVVVVHSITKESEQALLQEQQKSVEIKQAIGAEEISKKGISDVAAAVAKTTGISKQEGSSSIYVRGLGDRYNSTTMNGLPLPSNNPSTKNISLDIFSTDIVEYIGIDKTYNFRNYGDFAGANVDIVSKNYKGNGIIEFGTGFGANSNAIQQDKFYLQDGPNFYGFSNESIPNNPLAGYNFNTSWDKQGETPINGSMYLRGGDSFNFGEISKISFFLNASFDNGYTYKEGVRRGGVEASQGIAKKDLYRKSYEYQTNSNFMANINYKINNHHNLRINSMFINSSSQKHEEFTGILDIFDNATEGGGFIRRSTFDRTALLVNQLLGEHKFGERTTFDWGLSYNILSNVVPDRMQNTFTPSDQSDPTSPLTVSDLNQSDNHRYYQDMTDDEAAGNFTLSYKFGKNDDTTYKGKFIAGYSARYKEIDFNATQINFGISRTISQPNIDLNNIDGYFNQNNFNAGLFTIRTFRGGLSSPNALDPQNFNGQQIISAGFGAVEYQFTPKLYVIAAFRSEFIIQDIEYNTSLKQGENKFDTMEYLPSLTAKYELNDKQNLKFAASKTYTLPQFKERAPFLYEEVGQSYFGNPYLYNSTDYNVDLKWEYFPKNGEVISITGFGKYIQNPINEATVASATNDISWVNSGEKALGLGGELEIRKNLITRESSSTNKKTNLSTGLNISYLYTNQDLDSEKVLRETNGTINVFFTNKESRLTGASDLLINSDISFNKDFSKDKSLTATLSGSYFSDRIAALGVTGKGDLVDSDVVAVDFILKYKLNKNIGFGFGAKNLSDPTIERRQDIQNVVVDSYKKGRNFSLSMKYTF
ncbi:MAG: hypothetical protein ACJAYP_000629 [Flavobacterium sp.]|jgi:hypothetical protein